MTRTTARRHSLLAGLVAVSFAAAACGGDEDSDTDTTTADSGSTGSSAAAPASAPGSSDVALTAATVSAETATSGTVSDGTAGTAGSTAGTGGAATATATATATEEEYVDAGAAAVGFGDEDLNRCIVQSTLDAIGFDTVTASGAAPADYFGQPLSVDAAALDEDALASLQDDVAGCGDLLGAFVESDQADPVEVECGRELLTNELMAEVFVTSVTGREPSAELTTASEAMDACTAEG